MHTFQMGGIEKLERLAIGRDGAPKAHPYCAAWRLCSDALRALIEIYSGQLWSKTAAIEGTPHE
jgi:hypothetical protein